MVIMCNASKHVAAYVFFIKNDTEEETGETNKFATAAFGSKRFTTGQKSFTKYGKEFLAILVAFGEFGHNPWGVGNQKTFHANDRKQNVIWVFQDKHSRPVHPSLWNFCEQKLHFISVLAHVPGDEYQAAGYMSHLEFRPVDIRQLKLTHSNPVYHLGVDIAPKMPKPKVDDTDYYPHDEADGKIQNHQSSTPDDEPLGHTEQEHLKSTENDVHQMTVQDHKGHRDISVVGQKTLIRIAHTNSFPPRETNNVIPSITVEIQVVQGNKGDLKQKKSILTAPPAHVNFGSQLFSKSPRK